MSALVDDLRAARAMTLHQILTPYVAALDQIIAEASAARQDMAWLRDHQEALAQLVRDEPDPRQNVLPMDGRIAA